jgi:hypothetical protein
MHNIPLRTRKGQIFTWDLVFGIIIYMITLAAITQLWETTYQEVRRSEESYEMNWLSETAADQLVRTGGDPHNWTTNNAIAYGLAETRNAGKIVESRVLDADKVLFLIDSFNKNYTATRSRLLGSAKYDVYMILSCLNRTDMHCLQGLPLDQVSDSVKCNNQRIHVNKFKRVTDAYVFLEAEELWGHENHDKCDKGCSADNMSRIDLATGEAAVRVMPGTYNIWGRTVDDPSSSAKLVVDGVAYQLYNLTYEGAVGWNWIGRQALDTDVEMGFAETSSGDLLDAILLTTDDFYDPRGENPLTFGDPNVYEPCIVGNPTEGADIVSSYKTAIMGGPISDFAGVQPIIYDTVELKLVVWGGTAMPPRNNTSSTTSTTTTTLQPNDINCTVPAGGLKEGCVSKNLPVIDVKMIDLWGASGLDTKITCGADKELTVQWRGKHAGDPNYFGFFIDNSSYFVGACRSNNTGETQGQIYDYDMNCSINVPVAVNLPDGDHDLIVTAEDFRGYCYPYPTNVSADDEEKTTVQLEGCVTYTDLPCTPVSGTVKEECRAPTTVEKIYKVEVPSGQLVCGSPSTVRTYWGGTHGADMVVQWTYLIKDTPSTYICVGRCRSEVSPADTKKYYNLTCNINMNTASDCKGNGYSIAYGTYDLYVVAETEAGYYCMDPLAANADAAGRTSVTVNCGGAPPSSPSSAPSSAVSSQSSGSSGSSSASSAPATANYVFSYTINYMDYFPKTVVGADLMTDIFTPGLSSTTPDDGTVDYLDGLNIETVSGVPAGSCTAWNVLLTLDDSSTTYLLSPDGSC